MQKASDHLERLALVDVESASTIADAELAKAEAESIREALNQAIENFKNSKEFKEEILEGGFTSYCIGYEDGRDAVEQLYPDLDLSSIIPPASKDEAAEEGAAPTAPKDVPIVDAAPKQRDGDDDW